MKNTIIILIRTVKFIDAFVSSNISFFLSSFLFDSMFNIPPWKANDAYITTEIAKLLLGRIGENSILMINADNHQTDNKVYDRDNGIIRMIEKLSGNPLFGYVYLSETLRSDTANLANLLD